jgi:hypothetical protein
MLRQGLLFEINNACNSFCFLWRLFRNTVMSNSNIRYAVLLVNLKDSDAECSKSDREPGGTTSLRFSFDRTESCPMLVCCVTI